MFLQIGFLSEWQMYVQQVEGSSWREGVLDKTKLDKMSGNFMTIFPFLSRV
jgi:hypothetical protein